MVNAQQWLEKNYPNKEVGEIYINEQLEGELNLRGYSKLKKAFISRYLDKSKFEIKKNEMTKKDYHVWGREVEGTAIIQFVSPQEYLQRRYPTKEEKKQTRRIDVYYGNYLEGELDLSDFTNLEELKCGVNKLTSLKLSNCDKLKRIWCRGNQLTNLDVSNLNQLESFFFSNNYLTQIIYPTNPELLTKLSISGNNLSKQDLTFFSRFSSLEILEIGNDDLNVNTKNKISRGIYNRFMGSLEPLRDLNKLKKLNISNTDIDHGLEYLPRSIKELRCSFISRPESRVSDIWEELNPFEGKDFAEKLKNWREVKLDKKLTLLTSPLLPPQLISKKNQEAEITKLNCEERNELEKRIEELESKTKSNNKIDDFVNKALLEQLRKQLKVQNKQIEKTQECELNYNEIHFNQWGKHELSSAKELPIKLYKVKDGKEKINTISIAELKQDVIKTDEPVEAKIYANLSYLWGECKDKINYDKEGNFTNLTQFGRKALTKAIKACELLKIDYLWIDQLCINQDRNKVGQEEREQEVPKMRQYYSNGTVTLIAIDGEVDDISDIDLINILKLIVNSEWFTRSWTFQEGWLSKHTIFMFDDKIIDGRAMAGTWALNQLGYANEGRYNSRSEFNKGTKKIATPVGWVYYRDGYTENDKVSLTLSQALKEVKKRGRSIPVDGIYSILGLLPYGENVKVDYSLSPRDALYEVMKVAVENGYGEPLTWHGTSNTTPSFCWMPQIYEDDGSTSVKGGIDVRCDRMIYFGKEGIDLNFTDTYITEEVNSNIQRLEGGFEIEGGLYKKDVKVKKKEKDEWDNEIEEIIEVSLLGTYETLKSAEKGKVLVIFDKEKWTSNKNFALLVEDTGKIIINNLKRPISIYHRLGLVELGNEKLQVEKRTFYSIIIIGNNFPSTQSPVQTKTNQEELKQQQQQAQIEQPPK